MRLFRKQAARRRPQPRPRVQPFWRRRSARTSALVLAVAGLLAVGAWAWWARWPERIATYAHDQVLAVTLALGFRVDGIYVVGRKETPSDMVLAAVAAQRGDPILGVDLIAARERVLALPWVQTASIERVLPNTLLVRIEERRPLALWQHEGEHYVLDTEGKVIPGAEVSAHPGLLLVVGEDAPPETAALLDLLAMEPLLAKRVRAAVRVGGRRWDLHLANDIEVRLPEQDPAGAWARLNTYQIEHGLLDRAIRMVDLRLDDRLVIRRDPTVANRKEVRADDV